MQIRKEIQIRDPFVLPVVNERTYYLFGTTDKNAWEGKATGFDAYLSKNLEIWEGPFPAFRSTPDFWADENFWAPEVHFYKGKYYMFASFKAKGKCRATQILVADKPIGPFVPHSKGTVTPLDWECLDGTLYVDEEGSPFMIFCHEWVQVHDGEICIVSLSDDIKSPIGESTLLFHASDAPWSYPNTGNIASVGENSYVTDGPFLYRAKNSELLMLWSSYTKKGYAIGVARSETGKITGPWKHDEKPIYGKNGGHGMIFKTFDERLMLTIHTPNETPNERPIFIELLDIDGQLIIAN